MTKPSIAVIIPTKNRAGALRTVALPSLERSEFRDFACLVWDASEDDDSRKVVEDGGWSFELHYEKALRPGSSSQRNDAVLFVQKNWPEARWTLFIDDDSELSPDALEGVRDSFRDPEVWGVSLPFIHNPYAPSRFRRLSLWVYRRLFRVRGRGVVLPCLYFYLALPEERGAEVDWTRGGGMAFRMEVFTKLGIFFPEAFQRFGGYAAYEDQAFSFHLKHNLKRRIVNSLKGGYAHHPSGGRTDTQRLFAARWFNIGLFFEEVHGRRGLFRYHLAQISCKTFYLLYFTWHAIGGGGLDVFRGLCLGSRELRSEKREKIAGNLFKYGMRNEWNGK